MPSNSKAQNYPPLTHGDSCVTLDSLYRLHKVGFQKGKCHEISNPLFFAQNTLPVPGSLVNWINRFRKIFRGHGVRLVKDHADTVFE